jgi:tetratricopeptide (TPR) repeat protein
MAQQDIPTAIAALETCIALDPDNVTSWVDLGRCLRHVPGDAARWRARDHLRDTVARWPDNAEAQLLYGLACFEEMPATAGGAFRRAVALDPDYVEARFNLGVLAEGEGTRTGRHRAADRVAIEHYSGALAVDPDYMPALTNVGTCLLRLKRPAEAIQFLERAVAIEPLHPVALGNLGSALAACGRVEEARTCFIRLLEADPENAYARGNLAGLSGIAVSHHLPTR